MTQCVGGIWGVWFAHLMFELPVLETATKVRAGPAQMWSEFIASFDLLLIVHAGSVSRAKSLPLAITAYITAAYWFTVSTSFANPVVTLTRSLTDTFTGIRPGDVPGFVVAQFVGCFTAIGVIRWLLGNRTQQLH